MGYTRSLGVVRQFIEQHDLRNRHSQVIFKAIFIIETDHSDQYRNEHEVMIHDNFNSDGEITVLDTQTIDASEYPTKFMAKFQDFSLDEGGNLKITGRHPATSIENYRATFIPLGRKSD